jgi:hypothetical protein
MRRRLKLPDGGQKEFDIAGAATVTRALRLHYLPRLILQSARLYDLRGDIKQGKARYHWDARPLHGGIQQGRGERQPGNLQGRNLDSPSRPFPSELVGGAGQRH